MILMSSILINIITKGNFNMMKIALQVNGKRMVFSQGDLTSILEEHFNTKEAEQHKKVAKVFKRFEVKPKTIKPIIFAELREDLVQEGTRQAILMALTELKLNPEKYGKKFVTAIPDKEWGVKTVRELQKYAESLGGHMADWVEQALEWAQRISNGETWESVCNKPDSSNWYRAVISNAWKNEVKLVGGSCKCGDNKPEVTVSEYSFEPDYAFRDTVPLVVLR